MSVFSGPFARRAMAQHRETKRIEARARQAAFDQEVSDCARRHNISEREARRVVNAMHVVAYRKGARTSCVSK